MSSDAQPKPLQTVGKLDSSSTSPVFKHGASKEEESQRCACDKVNFYTLDAREPLKTSQKLGKLCDLVFDPACNLCKVLKVAGVLRNKSDDSEVHIAAVHTSVLIRCRSTGANDWWEPREVTDAVDDTTSYVVIATNKPVQEQWEIRQTGYSGFIAPVQTATSVGMWHARPLARRVNMELVKSWLNFCNEHHASECFDTGEPDFLFPLRVIDCTTRHVVQWPHGSPYIALSYVLGGKSANFRPDTDEMPFQLPDVLAQNFEDAILVTETLGLRYLWIDQYCIEQSSAVDKAAQIGQMDSIYRHAWLTIVAAAGQDVDFGLPGVSYRTRKSRTVAKINRRVLMAVPPNPDKEIRRSTWMKRGWTYQESILSHRILVFGPTEVYFECDSLRCSESTDLPFNYDDMRISPNEWHRRTLFPSITPSQWPGPFDDFFLHVLDYSKRRLTYSSDALNAIKGIMNSFERVYPQFITFHGLPLVPESTLPSFEAGPLRPFTRTEQLLRSFCWYPSRPDTRNTRWPSFSWLGWSMESHCVNAPYGHIINEFDVRVYFRSPNLEEPVIPFEDWCSMDCDSRDSVKDSRHLILDGKVIGATILPCEYAKDNLDHYRRDYFTVFRGRPTVMMKYVNVAKNHNIYMKNTVTWTLRREDTHRNSNGMAHEENLLAIPLGEQVVWDRLSENGHVSRCYIMLLVKEVQDGWERVALAEFNDTGGGYMTPPTAQLSDGSAVRKRYYTADGFRRLPFFRRPIRLV